MGKKRIESAELEYPNRIKELRNKEGLTQEGFINKLNDEEKISITNRTLSDLENGKKTLSPNYAIPIAKIFNVSLDWLYALDEKIGGSIIEKIERIIEISPSEFDDRSIPTDNPDYVEGYVISIDRDYLYYLHLQKHFESGKMNFGSRSKKCSLNQTGRKSREFIVNEELSQLVDKSCDMFKKACYDKIFNKEPDPKKKHMGKLIALYEPEKSEYYHDDVFNTVSFLKNYIENNKTKEEENEE